MSRKTARGSHRSQERRLRIRMRAALAKQRGYIADMADLVRKEQALIDELNTTQPRADELAHFDEIDQRRANNTMTQYVAKTQQLRDLTADLLTVLDELDALDNRPRLLPVRDIESATTDEHVTSLLDASQFQILTRSLDIYGISSDDYRRLFGLADDYLLWTKKVQETRRGVVLKHEVWNHHKRRPKGPEDEGEEGAVPKE